MQGLVKAERVAHSNHRDAGRSAEIGEHLPDELMQFGFSPYLPPAPQVKGSHVWARFSVFLDWQPM